MLEISPKGWTLQPHECELAALVAILSPLHYPMLWNDWASLISERRTAKSVEAVYQGNSVFVWLPTGFGKSICYQNLPFVIEYKKGQRGCTLCHC